MMIWLRLFTGIVSIVEKVSDIWKNRQLMKAGEAKANLKQLEEERVNAEKASKIRNKPSSDARRRRMLKHPDDRE